MKDDIYLGTRIDELKHAGWLSGPVSEWDREPFGENLLLVARESEPLVFAAIGLEWCSSCDGVERYEVLFKAEGAFDGVRHIWFGELQPGYLYYPNIQLLSAMLGRLREIEKEVCRAEDILNDFSFKGE